VSCGQVKSSKLKAKGKKRNESYIRQNPLVLLGQVIIFDLCQFTNFIVKSAGKTARFSSVPQTGKTQNAHSAARRSCPRNSPPSLPQAVARVPPVKWVVAAMAAVAAPAAVIDF
jgi:hypothetical protein